MRTLITILVIITIAGILVYAWGKKSISKLSFDIGFKGVDLRDALGAGLAQVNLSVTIDNRNSFSIPVSGLYAEVYYQGSLLAKSLSPQSLFIIPSNGSISINHSMNVGLGSSAASIISQLIVGNHVDFTYIIKARLFNVIPLTYKGSFTY